jgi:beta-glucosidase
VLLSNDGTLPLSPTEEVAVFGRCQRDWFFVGYGSGGDVHPPYEVDLVEGLCNAGARVSPVLAQVYAEWCGSEEHAADEGWWGHWPTHHPEMPVSPDLAKAAAQTAKTAVVVVGRCAGEDLDLPLEPGGYLLAEDERELLRTVTEAFERTVVVLNVGNAIDLSWVEDEGLHPSALLLAWQGGMESGNAVADVLLGQTSPSGRLACTFARSYEAYPSSTSFGSPDVICYDEDVFVGYRHFNALGQDDVLYPFGHGLSYTSFRTEPQGTVLEGDLVSARVRVTNTGERTGKETVLLWCAPPQGDLPMPPHTLAAFAKTRELEPGESQDLTLACDLHYIAPFDERDHAFVLGPGTYRLSANDEDAGSFEIAERRVLARCSPICLPSDELRERICAGMPQELPASGPEGLAFGDVVRDPSLLDAFVSQLDDDDLERLTRGEGAMNSTLGAPGNAGALGGVSQRLRDRGIPAAICADGPSGARLQRTCSLLPCATALASTWNVELVERLFAALEAEVREAGIDILLAPGMNIQRDPRCGRNFEYFSEDPLITGYMATAVVRGLQSAGVSACPKHLACNSQEYRRNTSDSRVSERALREIYLRGFELCVREGHPDLVMTSYNKVNGVWAHYHYDLATTVLRGEWGFEGLTITDWWMRPARSPEFPKLRNNAYRIRAGVDVLMPGSMSHVLSVRSRPRGVTRGELQQSARRVLRLLVRRATAASEGPQG